jgi:hypothetical protein
MSIHSSLLLAALLATGTAPRLPSRVLIGPFEAPSPAVTWKDLCARPAEWLGKTVRLQVQYHGAVESWNPYLTRFGSRQYVAAQAWADEQFPWIKEEYDAPAVRVFARRGEACAWALDGAKAGARLEITAVVRDVFLDLPWIEVIQILPLPERITEGTLIHAGKACELMKARSFELAKSELDQAITDDLPARARGELERLRALCRSAIELERGGQDPPSSRRSPPPRR